MHSEPRTTPAELKRRLEEERTGHAFLEYRDQSGAQAIVSLDGRDELSLGRNAGADISLTWDDEVSGLHAELERIAGAWVIADDGLSRNGTWVSGERVVGKRRLRDGDAIRAGSTILIFRDPASAESLQTAAAAESVNPAAITDTQRRVLVALCRPFASGAEFSTPATNKAIAEEVFLSVDAVKAHLRALFERFNVGDLPQNQKRIRLAELAMRSGVVAPRDL